MADPITKIQIAPEEFEAASAMLLRSQLKQAAYQAVKRTTAAGVAIVVDEVQARINITNKYARRAVKSEMDHAENPVGTISIREKPTPLIAFKPRVSKRHGVTVQFGKNTVPITYAHAFKGRVKAKSKSGDVEEHDGIFMRARGGGKFNRKTTPAGYAERLPIKQLYGPSVYGQVEGSETVRAVVEASLMGRLEEEFEGQLNRFLGRSKVVAK